MSASKPPPVSTDSKPGLFELGLVVVTQGVAGNFDRVPQAKVQRMLQRHHQGDWGQVSRNDAEANQEALKEGHRIMSVYKGRDYEYWIITEADRSATTVLLPDEY